MDEIMHERQTNRITMDEINRSMSLDSYKKLARFRLCKYIQFMYNNALWYPQFEKDRFDIQVKGAKDILNNIFDTDEADYVKSLSEIYNVDMICLCNKILDKNKQFNEISLKYIKMRYEYSNKIEKATSVEEIDKLLDDIRPDRTLK